MDIQKESDRIATYLGEEIQRMVLTGRASSEAAPRGDLSRDLQVLFTKEGESRPGLDADLSGATLEMPLPSKLSPTAEYFLIHRCFCALDWLGTLSDPEPLQGVLDTHGDALLQWLLVPLWARRHDHWLKMVALSGGSGPLYAGPEPAS